ncbi:low affinity immunoglobulin epsilon Fc receptor-like [Physella acuta]|uniref:low affinity immunoglobulin epsilon Fc receptor-like n=1 Tax=Physella acuta TaxID=109671 RepID=UPI0027DC2CF4|nr:low affinity immunoglobulin epsilon Fc receptor-like [Physella acuta]
MSGLSWCLLLSLFGTMSAQCISSTALSFENKCYEIVNSPMTWQDAKSFCAKFTGGRSLAKVLTTSEMLFLSNPMHGNGNRWTGANDIDVEGSWVWDDNTPANLTSLWASGEPNSFAGKNEDCVELITGGRLNDESCDFPRAFICMEKEKKTPEVAAVAFTVGLSKPLDAVAKDTVIYTDVITNTGNAYNSSTGVFKCPKAGSYFFEINGVASNEKELRLSLMKNKIPVVSVEANANQHRSAAGNSAVLMLEKGDEISVQATSCGSLYGAGGQILNTFSGFLIA